MDKPIIFTVAGHQFTLLYNTEGYLIGVDAQYIFVGGSPLHITFTPAIGPLGDTDFGMIYQQVLKVLQDRGIPA